MLSFNHVTERDIEEGWSCGHFATSVHLITFLYALYTKYTTNGDDGVRQLGGIGLKSDKSSNQQTAKFF